MLSVQTAVVEDVYFLSGSLVGHLDADLSICSSHASPVLVNLSI